jgi:D-sedoheptulose 7-phosphate isomerase
MGIGTIGFLGGDGGAAAALCDVALIVPSSETARIQETHIALGHAILELLEDRLIAQ